MGTYSSRFKSGSDSISQIDDRNNSVRLGRSAVLGDARALIPPKPALFVDLA